MLVLTEFPTIGELPVLPDAARLLLLLVPAAAVAVADHRARARTETVAAVGEAPALFMGVAWDTLLDGNVRTLIERDLLVAVPAAAALVRRQGAPACARRDSSTGALLRRGAQPLFLTIVEVDYEDGERDSYFLPLAICAAADAQRRRRAVAATRCWRG